MENVVKEGLEYIQKIQDEEEGIWFGGVPFVKGTTMGEEIQTLEGIWFEFCGGSGNHPNGKFYVMYSMKETETGYEANYDDELGQVHVLPDVFFE